MSYFDDLLKKLKQGATSVAKGLPVVRDVDTILNYRARPEGPSVGEAIRQVTPFEGLVETMRGSRAPGIEAVRQKVPPVKIATDFVANRIAQPVENLPSNVNTVRNPKEKAITRALAGLGVVGAFSPGPEDVGFGAFDALKARAAGKDSMKGFSGEEYTGLGDAATRGKGGTAADALNIAELPLLLGIGALKARGGKAPVSAVQQAGEQAKLFDLPDAPKTLPKPFVSEVDLPKIAKSKVPKKVLKETERVANLEAKALDQARAAEEGLLTAPQLRSKATKQATTAIKQSTKAPYIRPRTMSDTNSLSTGMQDIYRNIQKVYKKDPKGYAAVKSQLLDPFDASKGQMVRNLNQWAEEVNTNVVKKYNIRKGSKESALVQRFGEKLITPEELVQQVGPVKAQQIAEADAWFRAQYNRLLDEVNATRAQIYPNDPTKIIPKRDDYYHHFKELGDGLSGLKNMFEDSSGSSTPFNKPNSAFLDFAKKRLGAKTEEDAVGGFLDYVSSAEYSKNIDPHIVKFRSFRTDLDTATGSDPKKLPQFKSFLDRYANDLAGQSNPLDQAIRDNVPLGKQGLQVLNALNGRAKSNSILFNVGSSLAQLFNVPAGVADAGPRHAITGAVTALREIGSDQKLFAQSDFLTTRFKGDPFSQFDEGILKQPRRFANWLARIGDEVGTKYIWSAEYNKALADKLPNPLKYADDRTRAVVAGRGVGEVPLLQKAQTFQLIAPFQLEVANLWSTFGDWAAQGKLPLAKKLLTYSIASYIMNRTVEQIRGSDVSFDPLNAADEAADIYQDETDPKMGALKAGGRVAGEVLSSLPLGATVASVYPEDGIGDLPERSELFGEGDPTRFGSGLFLGKAVQDPVTNLLPPFGGVQAKRTIEGLKSVDQGYAESKNGNIMFPIEQNPLNTIQAGIFGKYSVPEGRAHFKEERFPLTDKEGEVFRSLSPDQQKSFFDTKKQTDDLEKQTKKEAAKIMLKENPTKGGVPQVQASETMPLPDEGSTIAQKEAFTTLLNLKIKNGVDVKLEVPGENASDYAKSTYKSAVNLKLKNKLPVTTEEVLYATIGDTKVDKENFDTMKRQYSAINSKLKDPTVPQSVKDQLYEAIGEDKNSMQYYERAAKGTQEKVKILAKEMEGLTPDQRLAYLASQKFKVGGQSFLTTDVADYLYDRGVLSKDEKAYLNAVKFDEVFKEFYLDRDYKAKGSGDGDTSKSKLTELMTKITTLLQNNKEDSQKGRSSAVASAFNALNKVKLPNGKFFSQIVKRPKRQEKRYVQGIIQSGKF